MKFLPASGVDISYISSFPIQWFGVLVAGMGMALLSHKDK